MINIQNLSKIFRTEEIETKALNEVSLTIHQGEFISIMGPSGSGKSTLLNIVGLLDTASSGSYHLLDKEIMGLKEKEKAKVRKQNIGFIFQNFNLIDELSVYDNIELPLIYSGIPTSQRKEKVEMIAERLGLSHRLRHFPQQLSGGQQQRVAVARALINDPKIILADEPTAPLDSERALSVVRILNQMAQQAQTAIIVVTHDEKIIPTFKRVYHIRDGETVEEAGEGRAIG